MQHRIIGPVVVQVYGSDVIQSGICRFIPKVSHWKAPGYIVPDERQLMVKGLILSDAPIGEDMLIMQTFAGGRAIYRGRWPTQPGSNGKILTDGRLSLWAVPESRNPGYPLPGYVMTTAYTAPGTDVWNRFQIDDNDR